MTARLLAAFLLLLPFALLTQERPAPAAPKPAYDQLVERAAALLKEGKLPEASVLVEAALALDRQRPEAIKLAAQVNAARKKAFTDSEGTAPPRPAEPAALTPEARRRMDVLTLIIEEADKAADADARRELLAEFLEKSVPFLKEHPGTASLWLLRAVAAMELDESALGRPAAQRLVKLGLEASGDPKTRKVMAMLDRRGWLMELKHWTNSLGMVFAPAAGVQFCIWETRVKDYAAYASAGGKADNEWRNPGFAQGEDHPVVKVSWDDAKAFCQWLTAKERGAGLIGAEQSYRLPTDAEWSTAVGLPHEPGGTPKDKDRVLKGVYPWGKQWPPPRGAGNYHPSFNVDSFENTSPAGSFAANQLGLFDLGGNAWEWCEDWYDSDQQHRVLRGGSWGLGFEDGMLSSRRRNHSPGSRFVMYGFRCVLVGAGGVR